jgi:hypothetical protein
MRVFISYSGKDLDLVEFLASSLGPKVGVDYWDASRSLGLPDWGQIHNWIEEADLVIVLITDATVQRAMAVGNEVGHAKAHNKPIIPLVASTIDPTDLGCLGGVTYQRFSGETFQQAVQLVAQEVEQRRKQGAIEGWAIVGALAGLAWLGSKNKPKEPGQGGNFL